MPLSTVINYNAGFSTSGAKLMGANAAAEGFLRAYLRYSGDSEFHAMVNNSQAAEAFQKEVRAFAPRPETPAKFHPNACGLQRAGVGTLYNEDPVISHFAWQRRWEGETAYSICGITHTTCTHAVLDAFSQLVTSPFHEWDALICTSQSVLQTVNKVLEMWTGYLQERLGANRRPKVELPVIPLGVDCDAFQDAAAPQHRHRWREKLGIGEQEIAFLFLGRLSFHAKANPFPMYRALEMAAKKTNRKLHLILAGWFANESLEKQFRESAAAFCPSVRLHVVDGRQLDVRRQIWFAADVFTSLSDNVQETFGLTPVEAMAAGLPTVISDWDGYRDTVRHELDGFRIPTSIAPAGHGETFVLRHFLNVDSYDRYIGHTSHFTAVDIPRTAAAYITLIENPELRQQMGKSAQQRAREIFDWPVIIGRYQELWAELARRRIAASKVARPHRIPHPLRPDPFTLFEDYATAPLNDATFLAASPDAREEMVQQYYDTPILQYMNHPQLLASPAELRALLATIQLAPKTVGETIRNFPPERAILMRLGCVWLLKVGLLTRQYPG